MPVGVKRHGSEGGSLKLEGGSEKEVVLSVSSREDVAMPFHADRSERPAGVSGAGGARAAPAQRRMSAALSAANAVIARAEPDKQQHKTGCFVPLKGGRSDRYERQRRQRERWITYSVARSTAEHKR